MAEILTGNAYGPDGSPGLRGQEPPASWPTEFVDDLRHSGLLADDTDHPALAQPLDDLDAAHDATYLHDPDDVIAATAAARIRLAAKDAGRHDIARAPVNGGHMDASVVTVAGRAVRRRKARA